MRSRNDDPPGATACPAGEQCPHRHHERFRTIASALSLILTAWRWLRDMGWG